MDNTQAVEAVQKAFADFRLENDRRLEEIATNGRAAAATVEKVERLNAEITRLSSEIVSLRRAERVSGLGRAAVLGFDDEQLAAQFHATLRTALPGAAPPAFSVDDYAKYRTAMSTFLRRGLESLSDMERTALQVGKDPAGGYFVVPTMDGRIVQRIFETSPMRQLCDQITISSDAYEYIVDNDEASVGYVSELGTRSESDAPDIAKGRIPVHEVYAEPHATTKVLEDSAVDVEGWLANKAADKLARYEAAGFISHNGSGQIFGFLAKTLVSTADSTRTWGQLQYVPTGAAGAFAASNPGDCLLTALYALKARYRANATWLMSSATEAEARKLKDGQGNYLWQPNFQGSGGATLIGRPVANGEDMPAVAANSYSIAIGDWKAGYLIVDRRGITLLRDPFTTKGRVKFHFTKRVGGDVVDSDAIKAIKFATT